MANIFEMISQGLKDHLDLKPLEGDQVVEFRLCRAGKVDPYSTKKTSTPQLQGLASKCYIKDPFDKKTTGDKLIMNIIGHEPIQEMGKPIYYNPILGPVHFGHNGSIFCTAENNDQYFFLKLHNKNKSNPNRKKGAAQIFYEVDVKKELSIKNNIFDYKGLVALAFLDADDEKIADFGLKMMRAYPTQFKFDLTQEGMKLKATVSSAAERNPIEFLLAVKEDKSYARVLVDDAVARRVIMFDDHAENLTWLRKKTPGDVKGKDTPIVKLDSPKTPVKGLVEFLLTPEGNKYFVELKQLHDQHYQKSR
jgi:hypothetical protein